MTIKQKTSHSNKDIKKAKITDLPKLLKKEIPGVAKRTGGGVKKTAKGKSL